VTEVYVARLLLAGYNRSIQHMNPDQEKYRAALEWNDPDKGSSITGYLLGYFLSSLLFLVLFGAAVLAIISMG